MMDVEEDLFAGFDLDEMKALEDGDLSIFSNFIDANFRLQLPNGSLTESDPSPQSTTPASSEELAMGNGLEEEDPQDHKHLLNLFDQHLNPSFNNNADLFPNNNNYTPTTAPKAKAAGGGFEEPARRPGRSAAV
ncbi:hypothetical protein M3Y99_00027600 [Aphelenchoides fujianensis]|nr:hypothetical protein M3Y99_00027600 [Aphelenchoides fujianensis]